jgi:WD domain, G-beta repeat
LWSWIGHWAWAFSAKWIPRNIVNSLRKEVEAQAPTRVTDGSASLPQRQHPCRNRILPRKIQPRKFSQNNTVMVWNWPTRKLVHVLKGHGDHIEGLSFMPDEEHLVTAGHDATTRLWRLDNGYSMAMLAHGGDWIVYTPDGFFDSSHYGGDLVTITRGLDTFGVDQFALQLNRPDLILSRMRIGSPEFIEHLRLRYQRRLECSGFHQAPALSLDAPQVQLVGAKQDGKFAQVEAAISDSHYPLQSYQV